MILLRSSSTLITPKKLCINCKHFIGNNRECAIFGDTNLVNGKNDYVYASSARNDEKKCGKEAHYFEENNMKMITIPYYFLLDYWPLSVLFFLYSGIVLFVCRK